jgi:hypothetical protein
MNMALPSLSRYRKFAMAVQDFSSRNIWRFGGSYNGRLLPAAQLAGSRMLKQGTWPMPV